MVYANEPEENSKFSDGLIKALTSDEPKGGVRELIKPPFELQITFTNTVMANTCRRSAPITASSAGSRSSRGT
jgi:putative DNA primase/helicase